MIETWKDVDGFDGFYKISNYGNVKSMPRVVHRGNFMSRQMTKEKLLTPEITNRGYYRITMQKDKIKVRLSIHRMVGIAFVSNPDNKPEINHKDGKKENNYYKNIEWCTHSENQQHAYKTGLNIPRSGYEHEASMPVTRLPNKGKTQNYGSLGELCRMENLPRTSVRKAIKFNREYKGNYYKFI